jgi:hypothetical protein
MPFFVASFFGFLCPTLLLLHRSFIHTSKEFRMLAARLTFHPFFFRSLRFAHKTPKPSSAGNKSKSKAKEEHVYEDYAAQVNNCQLEFSRFDFKSFY